MLQHTETVRLMIFMLVLIACALWESNRPRKNTDTEKVAALGK